MPHTPLISRRHALVLGAGIPLTLGLSGCETDLQPLLGRLISLDVQNFVGGILNLGLGLEVTNPNSLNLPELALEINVLLADQDTGSIRTASPFNLPANGSGDVNLNASINALGVIQALFSLQGDSIPYALSGTAETPSLAGLRIPFTASGTVPLS